jgi:hypothetical protein
MDKPDPIPPAAGIDLNDVHSLGLWFIAPIIMAQERIAGDG